MIDLRARELGRRQKRFEGSRLSAFQPRNMRADTMGILTEPVICLSRTSSVVYGLELSTTSIVLDTATQTRGE